MYSDILSGMAGGGAAAPAGGAPGLGAPPSLPGLPPKPTGVGAMPTGDPSTTAKTAASDAVSSLRDLKGHMPNLGPQIDGWIQQIVAAGKPPGDVGAPTANTGVAVGESNGAPPAPADSDDDGG